MIVAARRITVLHFDNARVRGGVEEHILTLLTGLDRARFKPMLSAHPDLLELVHRDLPDDVETIAVRLEGPSDLARAYHFVDVLRSKQVDIVHSHMFQASRLLSPLAWLAGIPARIETPHIRESWRHGWIKGSYLMDRIIGRFVTSYIAVSESNRRYLVNEKRIPAAKVALVRNGIRLNHARPAQAVLQELRHYLGISEDSPVVAVIARLEPQKGHRVLLQAWQNVIRGFPKAVLVCVGAGQLRDELENYAAMAGMWSSVRFVGYQADVTDWLALADLTVLPSFFEGLPLAAIESMGAGRPVIATAVDGTTEVVLDNETGLLVPPDDPETLAQAISRLLTSPDFARRLGSAGCRWVSENFDAQHQVIKTEEVYENALSSLTSMAVQKSNGARHRARSAAFSPKSQGNVFKS